MKRHLYDTRTYQKLQSFSERVASVLEKIWKFSLLMAILTTPIGLLLSFSETMTTICEAVATAWFYLSLITIGLEGFCFIITLLFSIVAVTVWEFAWMTLAVLTFLRRQIAKSFKV